MGQTNSGFLPLMKEIILRLAGSLTLLLIALILLIRAQPYDGSSVRDALLPQGCASPCFMGLRPGVTTLDEAVHFFEQRPRVHFVLQKPVAYNVGDHTAVMYWREDGSEMNGSLNFEDETLVELTVQGLELHEIWLALGEPDSGAMATELIYMESAPIFSRPTAHIGYYHSGHMRVQTPSTCVAFWQQLSYILMGQTAVPDNVSGGPTMAQQRQTACQQERAYLRIIREG
jgi:hypothetical protein